MRYSRIVGLSLIFHLWLVPSHASAWLEPDTSKVSSIQKHLHDGDQLRKVGFVQESLQNYFSALQIAEEGSINLYIATTSIKIGDLYEQYYRYNESIPYLKKSYGILKKTDSLKLLASVTNSIAWNYIKIGVIDSALVYSEESVKLYEHLQPLHTMDRCIALESLGEIYSLKKRYTESARVLDLCMKLGIEDKNPIVVGFTHYGMALNELNQKHFLAAKDHIMKCVPVAEKYASQELLADVFHLSFEVHRALGQDAAAYYFLERYTTLKDKIHSEDIEKKAAIINANYEIQKKEDDLKILTQLNSIQELEIERQALIRNIIVGGLVVFILIAVLIYNRIRAQRKFEQQELQRKKEELEQARKVQLSLLPQKPMANDIAEVRGKMITATEVGGDYYDYFQIDDHRVLIAFGDATGHGMTAGMMVTIAKVALINNLSGLKESNNLVAVVKAVNDSILSTVTVKGIGLALQLFLIDSREKKLTYTSCGMPYPMVYNSESTKLALLEMRQPPLGFFRQMKIEQKEISFEENQLLILSSDGIFERFNLKKEEYGIERFARVTENQLQHSPDFEQLLETIFSDTETFSEATPNDDDMTALCARLTKSIA